MCENLLDFYRPRFLDAEIPKKKKKEDVYEKCGRENLLEIECSKNVGNKFLARCTHIVDQNRFLFNGRGSFLPVNPVR